MNVPTSIFEETVRIHRIRQVLVEFGFLEYMSESELECLVKEVMWSDLDLYHKQDDWLEDLIKTVKWLSGLDKQEQEEGACWVVTKDWSILHEAIRKQSNRLECIHDDDSDGESWKQGV